jgi:cytochrome oxidase Cu insertion factor (SCO1/SenC/PrrC family)
VELHWTRWNRASSQGGGKPKRHYKKRIKAADSDAGLYEDVETGKITEKQFKKARKKLSNADQNGKLDENQKLALKALKGIRFKTASDGQKEQIMNMAKKV